MRFRLDSGKEKYTVLVSPSWYWEDLRTEIKEGSEVSVRGSKTLGRDMEMYIIAQEIRFVSSGQAWVFRDEKGFPLWKGQGGRNGSGWRVRVTDAPGRGRKGARGHGRQGQMTPSNYEERGSMILRQWKALLAVFAVPILILGLRPRHVPAGKPAPGRDSPRT